MPQRLCEGMEGERGVSAVGEALMRGWQLKKQLSSGITNPSLDALYEMAISHGATGGKIVGAGGGGFLLLYCENSSRDRVRSALGDLAELPFAIEQDGSKVIFNIRR